MKKLKIYLCDFIHDYLGTGTHMFPLNIGFIASYAYKHYPDKLNITLFKYPKNFLKQFKKEIPDVVGLSNYSWNDDLNDKMSTYIKKKSPSTIIIFGGPNIDYTEDGVKRFFKNHKSVDYYIPFQGEKPFINLLNKIFKKKLDEPIDGVYSKIRNKILIGKSLPRIKNPDVIPSPYLTGLLDKFFEFNLIPILETNRGCPYTCTYCCQGHSSHNSVQFFSLKRVKKEILYIIKKVKNTNILDFADANFGIVERDIEIAKYIAKLKRKYGYPRKVVANWAKNQPKIFELSQILKNINTFISMQSLNPQILKNIKRSNIKLSVFREILNKVNKIGANSGSELILGLPGETKKTHLESLRLLFDWNVSYIICYNCLILLGSELSEQKNKGEIKCKTKFRLIDNSYGKYDGMESFEKEEGIRELENMTEDDILYFRPIHWLIQFLWNYRFYYKLLKYIQLQNINPLDYIIKLIESKDIAPERVKDLFNKFEKEAKDEWFETPKELEEYYKKNFDYLNSGEYGKMNGKYIFKVLIECKEDFEQHLLNVAIKMCPKSEIFDFITLLSNRIIDFRKENPFEEKTIKIMDNTYNFYIPQEKKNSLNLLLKQYKHDNINVTLRKMSEYMDMNDFFYDVEEVGSYGG